MSFWILITTLSSVTIFVLAWFYARRINNYSIVDVIWAYSFFGIALLLAFLAPTLDRNAWIFIGMISVWSLRLGTHLGRRVFSHLEIEDGRYLTLRVEYGEKVASRFFRFFMIQALSVVFLLIPLFLVLNGTPSELTPSLLQFSGILLWITGWIGESLADAQLLNFKQKPENKGKVCEDGLWSWSRHPNYFFEIVIWFGFGTYALAYPNGWVSLVAPLFMAYLISQVTGVPYAEAQSLKSRGELYRNYQSRVSRLFPMPPKSP